MRLYFIKYQDKADINYLYLFMLYGLAENDRFLKRNSFISFTSLKDLSNRIDDKYGKYTFSYSTLRRILKNPDYSFYFTVHNNFIELHNYVIDTETNRVIPFITISSADADYLIKKEDALLANYFCYLKFYCGLAESRHLKQDFTIKQYLSTTGLSTHNNTYISKIASYNQLLVKDGYLNITKYRDSLGHWRNIYSMPTQ